MAESLQIMIASTFDLQDKANRVMAGEAWVRGETDWVTCALAEIGEGIGWTGYKHWKHSIHNWHQAFIEIVDSYHFMLSAAIAQGVTPDQAHARACAPDNQEHNAELVERFTNEESLDARKKFAKKGLKALARYCLETEENPERLQDVVAEHLEAAANLGFDTNQFFAAYVPKNVLNLFRQAYGDKEGYYPRMWKFEGATIEDNQVVEILTKRHPELSYDDKGLEKHLLENLTKFHRPTPSPKTSLKMG